MEIRPEGREIRLLEDYLHDGLSTFRWAIRSVRAVDFIQRIHLADRDRVITIQHANR